MDFLKITNNAIGNLDATINNSVTSLAVTSGKGALYPSTYDFHITVDDEIMAVTNRSTDTFTIVRAQQGTSAASHTAGAAVELRITVKHIDDITKIFTSNQMVTYGGTTVIHLGNVVFHRR